MNAKEELLDELTRIPKAIGESFTIRCCEIRVADIGSEGNVTISLKEGYTEEEYQAFLDRLDFDYDAGYGLQYIDGTVWFTDPAVWLERGEYDGSEWWRLVYCPHIPKYLLK